MTPKRVRTVEGSCWACKDRRVICDLQRPHCSRCLAEDQVCEYGKLRLRWCNGVAARGRFAGQNMPVSSNPQQLQQQQQLQQIPRGKYRKLLNGQSPLSSPSSQLLLVQDEDTLGDREVVPEDEEEREQDDEYHQYQNQSPSSSLSSSSPPSSPAPVRRYAFNILEMSSHVTPEQLMLYFEHIVIDRFNLSSEPVLVDLASVYKYPVLRYSVTAVANAHQQISLCPGRHDAFLSKRTMRLKAIQNFRTQLQTPYQQQLVSRRFLPQDLFIANVLLCILDGVIDPHDESAATHVHYRGGRAILSQWKVQQQLLRQKRGLPALMLSCFATMDLTYALLTGEEQYFQHTAWAHFAGSDGWWGVLPHGDPFLEIMRILSRLAQLGHLARGGNERLQTSFVLSEELETLSMALMGYAYAASPADGPDQATFIHNEPSFITSVSGNAPLAADLLSPMYLTESRFDYDQSWIVFCNAYRLAGLIYVYRVFHGLDVTHQLVQQATNLGLQAICETRLKGKLAHCLLFPALVIGAHCRTRTQQAAVLSAMRSTAAFLQFGSMRVMENFLQGVWARELESESESESESWWECFEPISKETFLF